MTTFLDGRKIADKIAEKLKKQIKKLKNKKLNLAIILAGKNPKSIIYIDEKIERAKKLCINIVLVKFSEKATKFEIVNKIKELNQNKNITGIIVQLPLPQKFDTNKILKTISPKKDVDGLNWPKNSKFIPPTPRAVLTLLDAYNIEWSGKNIVLIGKGKLVGLPLELMLRKKGTDPVVCDSKTEDIKECAKSADILISATGIDNLAKKDWIKKGAVVIDCAEDVNREIEELTSYITPKIGGIGPLTVI